MDPLVAIADELRRIRELLELLVSALAEQHDQGPAEEIDAAQ